MSGIKNYTSQVSAQIIIDGNEYRCVPKTDHSNVFLLALDEQQMDELKERFKQPEPIEVSCESLRIPKGVVSSITLHQSLEGTGVIMTEISVIPV